MRGWQIEAETTQAGRTSSWRFQICRLVVTGVLLAWTLGCLILYGQDGRQRSGEAPAAAAASLKKTARAAFQQGDFEAGREQLGALLDLYRQQQGATPASRCQQLADVAREYLRAGELERALELLGEAAEFDLPFAGRQDDDLASAAAGLQRRLALLDPAERYELLRTWSMPSQTRPSVRVLMAITPVDAPPKAFARAIGERPRDSSFAVADVGGVQGLFCSLWELVRAADEVGYLRRLTSELEDLEQDDVPHARFAHLLARIFAARRSDPSLQHELAAHAAAAQRRLPSARLVRLPPRRQVWQFGSGRFDQVDQRTKDFRILPYWNRARSSWCGGPNYPRTETGWCLIRRAGGAAGADHAAIRRWVAPEHGTVSIAGELTRASSRGNGIRALVVSERGGLGGDWTMRTGSVATHVESISVQQGEAVDFIVESIDRDATADRFTWVVRLDLRTAAGRRQTFDSATGFYGTRESHADLVLAAACLGQEWLRPTGEKIIRVKLEQSYQHEAKRLRPFLRYALASAIAAGRPDAATDPLSGAKLPLWIPASTGEFGRTAMGAVRPLWLAHQGHVLHLAGAHLDHLCFRYPLIGDFAFSCEAQIGGPEGTEGGVAYGGLGYETSGQRLKVRDVQGKELAQHDCPFVADPPLAQFNHFAIEATSERAVFSANRHPTWTDASAGATSPWIGLRAFGNRAPVFRNLQITGQPRIPRQVKLVERSSLRGWVAGFYGERITPPSPQREVGIVTRLGRQLWRSLSGPNTAGLDWFAEGDVMHGARRISPLGTVAQSRLYYFRPLQNGESIRYEFQYEPGKLQVHPTVGRLAFLIEPDGVRLHWMTAGELEWTGLAEDNAVIEPLNRRGRKPLPLRSGQWNQVTVALENSTLTLSLNETMIYVRKMEPENERTFGFYHDQHRSAARIRKVTLGGDWPAQLTPEQLTQLANNSDAHLSKSDRRLRGAIFADRHVLGSALAVHRQAMRLAGQERYTFLSDWVLPSPDHRTLRLALDFTPTNPAPPVNDSVSQLDPDQQSAGGEVVAPALDLVAIAKQLGKLDELRRRVASVEVDSSLQQRSQLALQAMIEIADENTERAGQLLGRLASLVVAEGVLPFNERCPETLAIHAATPHELTRPAAREMVFDILAEQVRKNRPSGNAAWAQHIRGLAGRIQYLDSQQQRSLELQPTARSGAVPEPVLTNWIPASRETMWTRGLGFPRARWERSAPRTVETIASHYEDYMFFRLPLRGDYEVECELTMFGWRETNLWVAGGWVGLVYTLNEYDKGDFRERSRIKIEPPFHRPDGVIRQRMVVRQGVRSTYINGRKVDEQRLTPDHDPWIAIRSPVTADGSAHNVRITGDPQIPGEVNLAASPELPGWLPINQGGRVGPRRGWRHLSAGDIPPAASPTQGGLRGLRRTEIAGSHHETLIRYHRPMAEDGTIEYEFFYRQGAMHVHPALDRLVFMLQPAGVRVHWVTDGQFDRTGLAPDNLFDEPQHRRGRAALPLQPDAWNRLQLSLSGDTVRINLNGEQIYERELERNNHRTFGLFYYADRTEAVARNIIWRGDWPRELPSLAEQELAAEGTEFLDESAQQLTAVFDHAFTQTNLPDERFGLVSGKPADLEARPDGLHMRRSGGEGYHNCAIAPRLVIHGDFDIVASFDRFDPHPSPGGSSGVFLHAHLDNPDANECLIFRRELRHRVRPQAVVLASYVTREAGDARRDRSPAVATEATSGRMRMARRGDTVYYLFAEADSSNFQLLATRRAARDDIRRLELMAQTQGPGLTRVVWKDVSIRAAKLTGLALEDRAQHLTKIDREREAFSQRFEHDFARDGLPDSRFSAWGSAASRKTGGPGLRLVAPGSPNWRSVGITPKLGLQGDFDVSVSLEEVVLAQPTASRNSALYLEVGFGDAAQTRARLMLVEYADGNRVALVQLKLRGPDGKDVYRNSGLEPAGDCRLLRIARRGKRVSFIYRKEGHPTDRIIAQIDVNELPVPNGLIHVFLHTGATDGQSEVVMKDLKIRGQSITGDALQPPAAGGLLKSLLDLFD